MPLPPDDESPQDYWTKTLDEATPTDKQLRATVLTLHEARRYEQVIGLLHAAILKGLAQPWMYEVLALSMQIAGRPKADVERVLLSGIDFSSVSVPNLLYSAAFLVRFDRKQRALELYRQASEMDPTRPEPYILGLRLARELKDSNGVLWAALGILARGWTKDSDPLHRDAEVAVAEAVERLRKQGNTAAADELSAAVAAARQRDLVIELSWSGNADLDLAVEEPSGLVCAFDQPRTASGGVLVHEGVGPSPKNTYERYVCTLGMVGEYRVRVHHAWGDVVGKRAVLKITRYQGSPNEKVEKLVLELASQDRIVRVDLRQGRLQAPVELPSPPLVKPAASARAPRMRLVQSEASRRERAAAVATQLAGQNAGFNVGYQPVITVLSEGVTNSALGVVSADRRYVRISLSPAFSTITGVNTFSFINSGGAAPQAGGS